MMLGAGYRLSLSLKTYWFILCTHIGKKQTHGGQSITCDTRFSPTMWILLEAQTQVAKLDGRRVYTLNHLTSPAKAVSWLPMCMGILPACVSVHWYIMPGEDSGSPGTILTCKLPCGCWDPNLDLLQEFLTTELSPGCCCPFFVRFCIGQWRFMCLKRPEEGNGSPGAALRWVWVTWCRSWEPNSGVLWGLGIIVD